MPLVVRVVVPELSIVTVKPVYVPLDDSIRLPAADSDVAGIAKLVVPKSRLLNHPPVVNVAMDAPVVNDNLGAVVVEPPDVLPTLNVLVLAISATVNPPVPV